MTRSAKSATTNWAERAQALAGLIPLTELDPKAIAALEAIPAGQPVAIACSGGADSTTLLLLLWAHLPARRGRWLIVHFDHGLRGTESAGDAEFVRSLARNLGETCVTRRWRRRQQADVAVSETAAREARWTALEAVLAAKGVSVIATGHHADDVAESMLMRLTRGAGTAGLAGPRPVQALEGRATRVRPLLTLPSRWIRESLRTAGIPWRDDRTNFSEAHFRNRVRLRVLPALAEASPQEILSGVARSRRLLEEDAVALDAIVDSLVAPLRRRLSWDLAQIRKRPVAVVRRVVLRWLADRDLITVLTRPAVDQLVATILVGGDLRMSAGRSTEIVFRDARLSLQKRPANRGRVRSDEELTVRPGDMQSLPLGGRISATWRPLSPALRRHILAGDFSPAETVFLDIPRTPEPCFSVRPWRTGDRYRPLGAPGRSTLQDMFVNRKILPELRMSLPVICMEGRGVIWVPGMPPAQELAIQPETKLVVQLTYSTPGPMVNGSIQP